MRENSDFFLIRVISAAITIIFSQLSHPFLSQMECMLYGYFLGSISSFMLPDHSMSQKINLIYQNSYNSVSFVILLEMKTSDPDS